jgi:hypothetical protein
MAQPPDAIKTAAELMRLIQEDMKASCSIISSMKNDSSDVDELIWLLKEDNAYLKVQLPCGALKSFNRIKVSLTVVCVLFHL